MTVKALLRNGDFKYKAGLNQVVFKTLQVICNTTNFKRLLPRRAASPA